MPMLTTVRIALAGDAGPRARADPVGEVVDPAEHLVHVGDDVLAVDLERRRRPGRRSAVCSTARSSVTLMCSPREHRVAALGQPDLARPAPAARPSTSSSTRFLDRSTCRSAGGEGEPVDAARGRRRTTPAGRARSRRRARPAAPRRPSSWGRPGAPVTASSAPAPSWPCDGLEQLVPGRLELLDALVLEHRDTSS